MKTRPHSLAALAPFGRTRPHTLAAHAPFGPNVGVRLAARPGAIDGPAEPDPPMVAGGARSAPLHTTPPVSTRHGSDRPGEVSG